LLAAGRRGICKVRFNAEGRLQVPYGYVSGVQIDPVEKKPFFHVHPGSDALTFGMMGCDFHCPYCQNWVTSQALRDEASLAHIQPVPPGALAGTALRLGARLVVSSYNEPLITTEWAVSVFEQAKPKGLACAFVSNGNATAEALDYLQPRISAYKVDLKGFNDQRYRTLGGTLDHVKRTIEMVYERKIWLEVLTLLVPGFNDDEDELRQLTAFIAGISRDIPWHVTAFHRDYKMTDRRDTTVQDLIRACEIGSEQGLHFVYAGNLPGRVGPWENTRCPGCGRALIERYGYQVQAYRITTEGKCPNCKKLIPGIWPAPEGVRIEHSPAEWFGRVPRPVKLN
jgi:pyruvate formate lyase activating enzyme